MILTGSEIIRNQNSGTIIIEPFDERFVEPNSYGFHLKNELKIYQNEIIHVDQYNESETIIIEEDGFLLEPGRFYLGSTVETIGSYNHTCLLYSRFSTSLCGIFIQTSAPVGHVGAIIPWTLEIVVAHPVIVYPGMLIGKISFWENKGVVELYNGKYKESKSVTTSLLFLET